MQDRRGKGKERVRGGRGKEREKKKGKENKKHPAANSAYAPGYS